MSGSKTRVHTYFDTKGMMGALEEVSLKGRESFAVKVRDTARKSMKPAPKAVEFTLAEFLPGPLKVFANVPLYQLMNAAKSAGIPSSAIFSAINLFKKAKKKKRQVPSKPGTPPHKQSGKLQKAVIATADKETGSVRVELHSDAWYGMLHEVGSRKHPKRPFLKPALQKHMDKLPDHLKGMDLSKTQAGRKMNRKRSPFGIKT